MSNQRLFPIYTQQLSHNVAFNNAVMTYKTVNRFNSKSADQILTKILVLQLYKGILQKSADSMIQVEYATKSFLINFINV